MRFRSLLVTLALFAVSSTAFGQQRGGAPTSTGPCPVQPEKYAVGGRVIAPGVKWDSYNEVLVLYETQLMGVGYTNGNGEYSVPAQPSGRYYIVIRIDGFKEYRERVDLDGCDPIITHFVYLTPEEEPIPIPILDFTGEVKEAVDVAELRRQMPKRVVEEFERARQDRVRGEADSARRRLEKLLKDQPDFYDALNVLGAIYLEKKLFREAEMRFNRARELRPNSAAPLVSLGSLYVQEAEASIHPEPGVVGTIVPGENLGVILDDARGILEEAIKIKPDASFAYYLLGVAYMRDNNFAKAELNLRKAIDLESQLRWAHIALANMYVKQGQWQQAVAEFDTYLDMYKKVSNRVEIQEARKKLAALLEPSK